MYVSRAIIEMLRMSKLECHADPSVVLVFQRKPVHDSWN